MEEDKEPKNKEPEKEWYNEEMEDKDKDGGKADSIFHILIHEIIRCKMKLHVPERGFSNLRNYIEFSFELIVI